jgi:hypothetical protein
MTSLEKICILLPYEWDNCVCITTGYGGDGLGSLPGRSKGFFLHQSVETGTCTHPISNFICTRGSLSGSEAAEA